MRQSERVLAGIVKIGLWLIPLLPLYIATSMLFPYITGRNFLFRFLVEIIFALWIGLAIARSAYRPRLTSLFKAVTIFVSIVFLADIFGLNPSRSIWGNYERMEGFMTILHLYLYFVMLVSMFRSRKDWMIFFHISLVASIIVSFYGLFQRLGVFRSLQGGFRIDGTIGNPTYLAAYLLFHIWLSVLFLKNTWKRKRLRFLYGTVFLFELLIIYFTATRGVVLALGITAFLILAMLVWRWRQIVSSSGSGRSWAAAGLAIVIIIPLILGLFRETPLVRSSEVLRRFTTYSLAEDTIRARFQIWRISWRGVLDRPVLGWGQENYYLVFQRYYDPRLYDQEPWFDRSHNVALDWLVHTGFAGFLSYVALFALMFRKIFEKVRRNNLSASEGLILGGLFLSYFLQNLFVFDNLNTYLLFFAFLAYSEFTPVNSTNREFPSVPRLNAYYIGVPLVVVVFISAYFLHLKPIFEGKTLLQALRIYQAGDSMENLIGSFEKALAYDTFGDTEVREQMGNAARNIISDERYSFDDRKRFVALVLKETRSLIEGPAVDVKHVLYYGGLLNRAPEFDPAYLTEAKPVLERAIKLSPSRQISYFELAHIYLVNGQLDESLKILEKAWELHKDFPDAAANLWTVAIMAKRPDVVERIQKMVPLERINPKLLWRIANSYQADKEYKKAIEIYEVIVERDPGDPRFHAIMAALLAEVGRADEARPHILEAIRLDEAYRAEGEEFLRRIQGR